MFKNGDLLVQKFGGSSMASPERIGKVADRIAEQVRRGRRVVLIVSAMGDTTDHLISLVHAMDPDPHPRETDQLMATGEMVTCSLTASALRQRGIAARSFNAFSLGIETDDRFGEALIKGFSRIGRLVEWVQEGGVAVVAGFQGITRDGDLTTLGRGGSDITAVALARELGQKVCEKYTDEDGVYSADPRLIPDARKVWHLCYDEMLELARYGNGILHPRSIEYAKESGIRLHVRSSFTRQEGSVISPAGDPQLAVKSITCDRKQAIMSLEGLRHPFPLARLCPEDEGVHLTAQEWRTYDRMKGSLRNAFRFTNAFEAVPFFWQTAWRFQADDVRFFSHLVMISLVGTGIALDEESCGRFGDRLAAAGISSLLTQRKGLRLSFCVPEESAERALALVHTELVQSSPDFFPEKKRRATVRV